MANEPGVVRVQAACQSAAAPHQVRTLHRSMLQFGTSELSDQEKLQATLPLPAALDSGDASTIRGQLPEASAHAGDVQLSIFQRQYFSDATDSLLIALCLLVPALAVTHFCARLARWHWSAQSPGDAALQRELAYASLCVWPTCSAASASVAIVTVLWALGQGALLLVSQGTQRDVLFDQALQLAVVRTPRNWQPSGVAEGPDQCTQLLWHASGKNITSRVSVRRCTAGNTRWLSLRQDSWTFHQPWDPYGAPLGPDPRRVRAVLALGVYADRLDFQVPGAILAYNFYYTTRVHVHDAVSPQSAWLLRSGVDIAAVSAALRQALASTVCALQVQQPFSVLPQSAAQSPSEPRGVWFAWTLRCTLAEFDPTTAQVWGDPIPANTSSDGLGDVVRAVRAVIEHIDVAVASEQSGEGFGRTVLSQDAAGQWRSGEAPRRVTVGTFETQRLNLASAAILAVLTALVWCALACVPDCDSAKALMEARKEMGSSMQNR